MTSGRKFSSSGAGDPSVEMRGSVSAMTDGGERGRRWREGEREEMEGGEREEMEGGRGGRKEREKRERKIKERGKVKRGKGNNEKREEKKVKREE